MKTTRSIICLVVVCLLSSFVMPFSVSADSYEAIEAEIPVACLEVEDRDEHIYQIVIEPENEISPEPESGILEITENGTGKFDIYIDEPGTFIYRIYEKTGEAADIEYDKNIYIVTVFVENAGEDKLGYAVSAAAAGGTEKPERIEFRNAVLGESEHVTTTAAATTTISTSTSTAATAAETSQTALAATTAAPIKNPIISLVESVRTGDTMPVRALLVMLLSAVLIMLFTVMIKKRDKDDGEEDENE